MELYLLYCLVELSMYHLVQLMCANCQMCLMKERLLGQLYKLERLLLHIHHLIQRQLLLYKQFVLDNLLQHEEGHQLLMKMDLL